MGNYPTSEYIIATIFFVIVIGGPIYAFWRLAHCKECGRKSMINTGESTDRHNIWKCKSCGYREGREDVAIYSPNYPSG